jgi:tetratricopeptide (TPR) repeat protein
MLPVINIVRLSLAVIIGLGLSIFIIWTSLRSKASKYTFGGAVYALMGNFEYADIRYKKALEIDPWNFEALYYMARRYAAQREFSQAVSCYKKCMRLKSDDPNVLFKLGAVFYDMNHIEMAVDLWKKFIEKSGDERNINMAASLLKKIEIGEKEVLSNREFLDDFKWHEEGFGASEKIGIFLIAFAVEFFLLFSLWIY